MPRVSRAGLVGGTPYALSLQISQAASKRHLIFPNGKTPPVVPGAADLCLLTIYWIPNRIRSRARIP